MTTMTNEDIERMNLEADDIGEKESLIRRGFKKILDPLATQERPTYRTLSIDDLADLKDPEWLLEGILPAESFVTLFGAPGSAKSFWALDAAMSIASGHRFHGNDVKPGKVIYAVGEGLRGMKWRTEAWTIAHPDADMDALRENLIILPNSVHLLERSDTDKLMNTVSDLCGEDGLALFIVDTWARALTGGDENSAGDAGKAIAVCDAVRDLTGASVLVVHHTGADGMRERGSTALRGASDTTLQLSKADDSDVTVLSCKKMKDGERFNNTSYRLESYGHSAALVLHTGVYGGMYQAPPIQGKFSKPAREEYNPFK